MDHDGRRDDQLDARAREAFDLARQIEILREGADVMTPCERMDILRSIDAKEAKLKKLMLQPPRTQ
jgi:hypothetical protein